MTPADHYHSKDCSTGLFNLNSFSNNSNNYNSNINNPTNIGANNSSNISNNNKNNHMGGQTPVFFAPSSFIVAGAHKPSQELHDHAMLAASSSKQLSRGPLQLVDFKEVVGGGGAEGGEQMRNLGKRPQLRFVTGGAREYDPGPGSAGSTGEDMNMEYMDHMEGAEYMDHMEGGVGELIKKGSRRLGYDQVKALEKAFEVENRLEPERKVRLASQLGLQPRQVAVWFQNRRARWKTKQMERDYSLLKSKFEALKADRDKLLQEKDLLQAELTKLKGHALKEGSILSKQATKGEQDSSTLASCSLVEDAAAHLEASKQAISHHENDGHAEEEEELEQEEEELEEASPKVVSEKKFHQNDSLSSTEDSDNGVIVDSTSKAFQEEPEYYAQHWRLPPPPTHLTSYKPTFIKNEEWQENGEHINSFTMPLDTNWYNW